MNDFIELCVTTTHEGSELVSDILWNYTDLGVVVLDIQDAIDLANSGKNWDYADDEIFKADKSVFVKAYFPKTKFDDIKNVEYDIMELKQRATIDVGSLEIIKREIDGEIWRTQWKEHFKPLHIADVVIVPEWIDYKEKSDEIKVLLDSNMAFGTGEHETTSMCIEFLSKYMVKGATVLDVGCGSGILGITASKLGAKYVVFTDIDDCAIKATRHNISLNNIENVEIKKSNLLDENVMTGDVIVANIIADVLISFAEKLRNNLKDNGYAILSGILNDRANKVLKAYEDIGFCLTDKLVKGEWTAFILKKAR